MTSPDICPPEIPKGHRNSQVVRQWRILRRLDSAQGVTIARLARDLGVCRRTIHRDLCALQEVHFPIVEDAGRWSLMRDGGVR